MTMINPNLTFENGGYKYLRSTSSSGDYIIAFLYDIAVDYNHDKNCDILLSFKL